MSIRRKRKKLASLAVVYNNYGEALEADLLRYWGVDINKISVRRMRNLYERLPYDSDTFAEIAEVNPESRAWSPETYMLANVIDAVNYVAWSVQAANSKRPPRRPKPVDRPKITKPKPKNKKTAWPGRTLVQKKEGNANG